ncbi:MAG: metallophosphoesterase [Chlamydiae bacterium]|nr:metallophosphoesterase [Chlamydiota bacterium]
MTKIIATSDFHGKLPKIPPADLLLIAGDICPSKTPQEQAIWLDTTFRAWLNDLSVKEVVIVAGNHDHIFEKDKDLVPKNLKLHYLQDSSITLFGITIFGTPWQLPFWGSFNLSDGRLTEIYKKIPEHVDIIISHGPPFGICDTISNGKSIIHTGSISLKKRVLEVKPKFCIFGHIHNAYGIAKEEEITFANVSLINDDLEIAHELLAFTL